MNTLPTISAAEAQKRLANGTAVLCDIREPMEHARENIPGAVCAPLSKLPDAPPAFPKGKAVIFHCQSGNRTNANADKLCALGAGEAYVLEGGLNAWKALGQPTNLDRSKPIEMQRQVQIVAGSLVLLGILLTWFVSPWGLALSAFVGAGLVFAGISGWCGMAHLLAVMPWNRMRSAS